MNQKLCDCEKDGHCQRYNREMGGRLREICQGVNVDPGTAHVHRQMWLDQAKKPATNGKLCPLLGEPVAGKKRECGACGGKVQRQVFNCTHPAIAPLEVTMEDCSKCEHRPRAAERAIILRNHLSPGDVLVMTAAIRSLHLAHPGKYAVAVDTTAPALFEHSPDVVSIEQARQQDATEIQTHYPAIQQSNTRGIHFMSGYAEFLSDVLGVKIPLLTNRPHVWLSAKEKSWMGQVQETTGRKQRYFLINAGVKKDFTAKGWGHESYQSVVDRLRGRVVFVQVGAGEHLHRPLRNVINLVGKTDLRQLVRLVHHADGVLCGVTLLQHLAAAMQKPAVVVMGGREPQLWNAYPRQQLMHTIGMLPCCDSGGCWRSRTVALGDGAEQDKSLCSDPIGDDPVPKCMTMIEPDEVAKKILQFLQK